MIGCQDMVRTGKITVYIIVHFITMTHCHIYRTLRLHSLARAGQIDGHPFAPSNASLAVFGRSSFDFSCILNPMVPFDHFIC